MSFDPLLPDSKLSKTNGAAVDFVPKPLPVIVTELPFEKVPDACETEGAAYACDARTDATASAHKDCRCSFIDQTLDD
ncbi:hypothetical protein [Povalibacter sp.]|uniref:hypothetical protein n=1 Tax=Povalibacter sp. TaxID=1962978 RepID=UPI002F40155B